MLFSHILIMINLLGCGFLKSTCKLHSCVCLFKRLYPSFALTIRRDFLNLLSLWSCQFLLLVLHFVHWLVARLPTGELVKNILIKCVFFFFFFLFLLFELIIGFGSKKISKYITYVCKNMTNIYVYLSQSV